jgi:arginine/ornithine N-succinyltransferase beta subunit
VVDKTATTNSVMVCNGSFHNFRVGLLPATMAAEQELRLPEAVLRALEIAENDEVLISPLKETLF